MSNALAHHGFRRDTPDASSLYWPVPHMRRSLQTCFFPCWQNARDGTSRPDQPSDRRYAFVDCRVRIKTNRRQGKVELWRVPGQRPGCSGILAVKCWLGFPFGYYQSANAVGAAVRRHVRWEKAGYTSFPLLWLRKLNWCLQAACPLNVQSARVREILSKTADHSSAPCL